MKLCLLDVPAAVVIGFVVALIYAKRLKAGNPDWWFFLIVGITAVFWLNAFLTVIGVMEPWFGLLPAVDVNGWIAAFTVLSYPLWYNWSGQEAMYLFGHDRTQAGMLWPFSIKDNSDPFTPSWRSHTSDQKGNRDAS